MKNLILTIICFSIIIAQEGNEEIRLANVNVTGNNITSINTIIFTAGLREGQLIKPTDFPRAIKRLWQLGLFQDIQLQYNQESEDGLSLTIVVVENFILGDLKFEGNKKLKNKKFNEELTLAKGQRIKPNTLNETAEIIKNLYAEKGYLNAIVEPSLSIPKNSAALDI